MKKINGGYLSLFEFLVVRDFPFARTIDEKLYPRENSTIRYSSSARTIDEKLYPRENSTIRYSSSTPYSRRYNETPTDALTDQFVGALQPLASMANDFLYTFKPYKSGKDALNDLAQPVRGLGNILRGLALTIASPLFFLVNTVRYAFVSGTWANFVGNMKINLIRSGSWLLDGVCSLVRGITQLITTPLTWFLKMPLRGILTGVKGTPDIAENEEVQRLVDLGHQAIADKDGYTMDCIRHRLHEEFEKSAERGQSSTITTEQEANAFRAMDFKYGRNWVSPLQEEPKKNSLAAYLGLFRKQSTSPADAASLIVEEATASLV
jgi:hypothetical protein